ncbi:MAG: ABC transporter substrate-binding protein [Bdellovibrionota bacterium]|nr:ABC transporter substrate-binding protein [Bdellovibrionota bacterium]
MDFLILCGLIGLVINFPLYIKNNLLHKYFVVEQDIPRFSSLQGTIYSLTFAIAVITSGVIYEYMGFVGVLVVDILTYVPLLVFLSLNKDLDYKVSEEERNSENVVEMKPLDSRLGIELSYYIANAATFFFSTLRSHILFTLLIALYGGLAGKPEIALWVLLGATLNLSTNHLMEKIRETLSNYLLILSFFWLVFLGVILYFKIDYKIVSILMSFSFTELVGLCLRQMRLYQKYLPCGGASEKVAFRAYLIATIVSSLSLPIFLFAYENIGGLLSFSLFGIVFFVVPFFLKFSLITKLRTKFSLYFFFILLVGTIGVFPRPTLAWEYKTAMSDKLRLNLSLATNAASEDERFLLNNIHCGLFSYSENGKFQGELAESWESRNSGLIYEIKIKDGYFDSTGSPVNASYVVEAMKSLLSKSLSIESDFDFFVYEKLKGFKECRDKKNCDFPGIYFKGNTLYLEFLSGSQRALDGFVTNLFPIYKESSTGLPITCGDYFISKSDDKQIKLVKNVKSKVDVSAPSEFTISFFKPKKLYHNFCEGKIYDALFLLPGKDELSQAGCEEKDYKQVKTSTKGYWGINLFSDKILKKSRLRERLIHQLDVKSFRKDWNLNSKIHDSVVPKYFGKFNSYEKSSSKKLTVSGDKNSKEEVLVRYIKGTPNSVSLEKALNNWAKRSNLQFKILPTPFTELVKNIFNGDTDILVYAELSTGNLEHFLGWIYKAGLKTDGDKKDLKKSWSNFVGHQSHENIDRLSEVLYETKVFVPLYDFERPLTFRNDYRVINFPDTGLAGLKISSFRKDR